LKQNYATYESLMIQSLTLQPFTGSLQPAADGLGITFSAVPGSVTAIALE
jgi:hypothetical protein